MSAVVRPSDGRERVSVMALDLDVLDERRVIDTVFDALDQDEGGWVVTPNVDIMRQAWVDPEARRLFNGATLLVTDGAPIEWAARLARRELPPRFPGANMIWSLAREAVRRDRTLLLLGGRPSAGELAAEQLRSSFPGLQIHSYCPPMGFDRNEREMALVRRQIRGYSPDLVICGLGAPKQERLMATLLPEFPRVWFFGLGGSIDLVAGLVPRAPEWMQATGVEWLFRLATEPRRLARRYLIDGIPFGVRLVAWALSTRIASSPRVQVAAHRGTARSGIDRPRQQR